MHALLLDREYGTFAFAVEQRRPHRLHEPATHHDSRRNLLQERAAQQAPDSRVPGYVYRDGARGSERQVHIATFARRRPARLLRRAHVGDIRAHCQAAERQVQHALYHAQDVLLRDAHFHPRAFYRSRRQRFESTRYSVAEFRGTRRVAQLFMPYGILVAVRVPRMEQGAKATRYGSRKQLRLRPPHGNDDYRGYCAGRAYNACRHRRCGSDYCGNGLGRMEKVAATPSRAFSCRTFWSRWNRSYRI